MGNTHSKKSSKSVEYIPVTKMKVGSKYKWLQGGFKKGMKMSKCATLKKKTSINGKEDRLEFDVGLKGLYKTRERKTRRKFVECARI
jgi:hypothetical protein